MRILPLLATTAALGVTAVPAAAQSSYAYPQYGYGYTNQGYGQGGVIAQLINQLLGNRYTRDDRWAVTQCAAAAQVEADRQYRRGYSGYGGYGYASRYGQGTARVIGITSVEQRSRGLRVAGLIDSGLSGYGGNPYGYSPGYGRSHGGGAAADLSFRCSVDYRGAVTSLRLARYDPYRRGY